jgi:hypothetical protein
MAEKETRFAQRDKDGNEIGIFTGKAPREAGRSLKPLAV